MENSQYTILVVDDNEENLRSTSHYLERQGYLVHRANNGFEAISKVQASPVLYALVILDYEMPGINGGETAQKLVEINKDILICIFSAVTQISLKAHNIEFLEKGKATPEELLEMVQNWCKKFDEIGRVATRSNSIEENETVINSVGLVGRSQALADIIRRVIRLEEAKCGLSVLIRGESGTGKERIARLLHDHSHRKTGPFVAVNMGSIQASLIESELFGHKKGSFTGAIADRQGKFRVAQGGTLFLDEIGDASLDVQVKLLRVLQEREYSPVGSDVIIRADVRIIAATNKNLEKAIEEGTFREDLYYRLRGVPIFIPPLRERVKDIEPVILATCEKYNQVHGTHKAFLKSTVQQMERLCWKGNIRDLVSFVEESLADRPEEKIPPAILENSHYEMAAALKFEHERLLSRQQQEIKDFFTRVLNRCSSQRHASTELAIPQTTLIGILERLGLPTDFKRSISPNMGNGNSGKHE